ncbi:aldose 1-epimerase family protein [Streptomyces sp. FIT100]|uniref:aldose 1-epimerase family protein n=1 Tax=Streptomyces sp. FIT100 TaxID=2837956 RepID=UPI0021C860DC|nr:aldose 1-epimerase family protein [Streptomyces sp. FIT100]UUN30710.1 aldose 1-epimerase family protein [Streptomyces sp. FIT100]
MRLHGQHLGAREIAARTGETAAAGGVRLVTLGDGAERGIRALEFRTGSGLAFDVLVDRCMDIGAAEHSGQSFGWRSRTGFRHPGLHEHADEDGLSWLRSFSGLTVTGGLDHTLFGGEVDADTYRYPPRGTARHGLHGRVANLPARLTGYGERWSGEQCVLWAEGEVRQAAVFAENLRLTRRIEADVGGDEIRLTDTVTNPGFDPTPHMFLYHINLGWPLLDAGSRFLAPVEKTLWQTDSVTEQGIDHRTLPAPQPGFVEQVYEHALAPCDDTGRTGAALVNDRLGLAVSVEWSLSAFPCFFQWLNLRAGDYAVGLEPSTHHVAGDAAARADGTMIWLGPGESRTYRTTFRVHRGADALTDLTHHLEAHHA